MSEIVEEPRDELTWLSEILRAVEETLDDLEQSGEFGLEEKRTILEAVKAKLLAQMSALGPSTKN